MKLNQTSAKALKRLIDEASQIMILSPDKPDLDSVGSNLALAKTFVSLGKTVQLLSAQPLKYTYAWMDWSDRYLTSEDLPAIRKDKPDLIVISDASGSNMFGLITENDPWLLNDIPLVLIDHHSSEPDFKPVLSIVEPDAAATGELLYDLYQAMGWEITPELANFMLAGIIFDTDRFANLNVDGTVLEVTGKLIELGGDFYQTHQSILAAAAMDEIRFKTLAKLQLGAIFEGPFVYCLVPYSEISHLKSNSSLIKPLINSLRFLKDIKAAFVIVERDDGKLILSTRSQPEINVQKICEQLGGGGHPVAAGAVLSGTTLANAAAIVLKELDKQNEALQHA